MNDKEVLELFLNKELNSANSVFEEFGKIQNAKYFSDNLGNNGFVYVPGTRDDRVLLIAHADTVFKHKEKPNIEFDSFCYYSTDPYNGIGADDRAGCAIVYLLKDLGHSILIVNGEEEYTLGARNIVENYSDIFNELNSTHQYMLEFDKGGYGVFETYNLKVSNDFVRFLERKTQYEKGNSILFTDICTLSRDICAANISIGYDYAHTQSEFLRYEYWEKTLNIFRDLLNGKQRKFLNEK